MKLRGIRAVAEASFTVTYTGHSAGEYFAELSASLRPDRLSSGQFPEAESRVEAVIIYLTTIEGCGILHLEAAHEPDRRCQPVRHSRSLQRFSGADALAGWRRMRPVQQQARIEICEAGKHPPAAQREKRTDGNEAGSRPHFVRLPRL